MANKDLSDSLYWRRPWFWAAVFAIADALWLTLMETMAWATQYGNTEVSHVFQVIFRGISSLWSSIHFPIRMILEPIFFSAVTTDPLQPAPEIFLAFEVLCLVQSAIVGYFVGVIILRLRRPGGHAGTA